MTRWTPRRRHDARRRQTGRVAFQPLQAQALRADRALADLQLTVIGSFLLILLTMLLDILVIRSVAKSLRTLARRAEDIGSGRIDGEPLAMKGRGEDTSAVMAE